MRLVLVSSLFLLDLTLAYLRRGVFCSTVNMLLKVVDSLESLNSPTYQRFHHQENGYFIVSTFTKSATLLELKQ